MKKVIMMKKREELAGIEPKAKSSTCEEFTVVFGVVLKKPSSDFGQNSLNNAVGDERESLERENYLHKQPNIANLSPFSIPKRKRTERYEVNYPFESVNVTSPVFDTTQNIYQRGFDGDGDGDGEKKKKPKRNQRVCSKRRCFDSDHEEKEKPKKKKMKASYAQPIPPPDLPANFRERITGLNGSEPVLIIQKPLYDTDVSKKHYRLSMPFNQVKNECLFIKRDEKAKLMNQNGGKVPEMEVIVTEPSCQKETKMNLKIWEMRKPDKKRKSSYMYCLGKQWNQVVSRNGLEEGMVLQVWAFRVDRKLQFSLVRV